MLTKFLSQVSTSVGLKVYIRTRISIRDLYDEDIKIIK